MRIDDVAHYACITYIMFIIACVVYIIMQYCAGDIHRTSRAHVRSTVRLKFTKLLFRRFKKKSKICVKTKVVFYVFLLFLSIQITRVYE